MRCFKAKQKLNAIKFDNSVIAQDQMLVEHLNNCSACAALVNAEQALRSDLHASSIDDNEEVVSNWILKAQVERQAAKATRSQFRENHLMAVVTNLFKKQSKLTIGVTTVAVVLLLSVLIPFSYNKTIGYEVAFAGVDKNLALDSDKLHVLLEKLGVNGAAIDVSGCEATCNVTITDLKSADDAKLVKAAFNEIDHVVLLQDVKELFETKEGNIFTKISLFNSSGDDTVHNFVFYADSDADDMHNVVIDMLGDELHETFQVWVNNPGNGSGFVLDTANNTDCNLIDISTETNDDGSKVITLNAGTDQEKIITLKEGEDLDTETLKMFEDMGISVQLLEGDFGSGEGHAMFLHKIVEMKDDENSDGTDVDESEDLDASAKVIGELPEGFELSQNYPNPFNPTTTISFSIPTSQHVTLEIINVRGQLVKTLVDQQMAAGTHAFDWDATNKGGSKVASGIYLYKLTTPENTDVKKMTLMK